tara:strand:+ start:67 stop:1080 length:1014 start_codon:yes stop_codon:yes gene_type:complete
MNVISLFNGMGTLRQAFSDMNIKVDKYYSSEIKPYAIELQQHHFPHVVQVGDINNWKEWDIDWKTIDFIGSGSPCQDLSAAGKRAGINGSRSSLFFTFVEILEHVKNLNPNVKFLQENVGSANVKDVGIMSRALGVYPARINSNLVTAQQRDRYYWTNIKTKNTMFDTVSDIPQPKDLNIMFKDILTSGTSEREKHTCLNTGSGTGGTQKYLKHRNATTGMITLIYEEDEELRVKTNTVKGYDVVTENDCLDLSFPTSKTRRGRVTKGKAPCLMQSSNNLFSYKDKMLRTVNTIEMCRLQGFKDDYCDILTQRKAGSLLGDGWTLPVIIHILSFMKI